MSLPIQSPITVQVDGLTEFKKHDKEIINIHDFNKCDSIKKILEQRILINNIIPSENISWMIIKAKWDCKLTSKFNKIAYIACENKIPFLYKGNVFIIFRSYFDIKLMPTFHVENFDNIFDNTSKNIFDGYIYLPHVFCLNQNCNCKCKFYRCRFLYRLRLLHLLQVYYRRQTTQCYNQNLHQEL